MQQRTREHWSSYIGFIFAAAGSAIGLGTLWKFPYVTGENGGGVFLAIYIFCIFFIGIPVFIAELILGRRAQRGAVGIFSTLSDNSAVWKGAGWLSVIAAFLIMSYYSVIGGWGLNYILMSLMQSYKGMGVQEVGVLFDRLQASGGICLFWHFLFTSLVVVLVLPGVRQGIEYWSKFMMSGLFILLFCLFLYALTLDGFSQALDFIFTPDIDRLKPSGILQALGLALFTLSLGQGIMLTYGSYMRKNEDIPRISFIVASMIIVASILSGLTIFPIIFTFGFSPEEGKGLVFKTLPLLFSQLPGSLLISTTFFILFVFAALTSAIAFVEVVAANMMDLYGWSRRKAVLTTGALCFTFGIPSALSEASFVFTGWEEIFGRSFFTTIDDLVSIWVLPVVALLVSLYTGWFLDQNIAKEEFSEGCKRPALYHVWLFFVRWIAPIAILAIMCQEAGLVNFDSLIRR